MQTPLSKLKNVDGSKNWDSLSQLTPTTIAPIVETTPAQITSTDTQIQPINLDDITPAKHPSSKRETHKAGENVIDDVDKRNIFLVNFIIEE